MLECTAPKTIPETMMIASSAAIYNCKICGLDLSEDSFSKSQINKLNHNKIDSVKCILCTIDAVKKLDESIKSNTEASEVLGVKLNRSKDPSSLYISNPRGAPIVKDALQFAADRGLNYSISLSDTEGWRTNVKLAVRGVRIKNRNGSYHVKTKIGLFKPGTHDVVSCSQSLAHHPRINTALQVVERIIRKLDIHGYIEGSGCEDKDLIKNTRSYLKYLVLTLARTTATVQLTLVWNAEPPKSQESSTLTSIMADGSNACCNDAANESEALLGLFVGELVSNHTNQWPADSSDGKLHAGRTSITSAVSSRANETSNSTSLFHSIWVNYNPSDRYSNAIMGRSEDSWRLLYGDGDILETIHTDMKSPPILRFPPFVFRQANICAFTNIIRQVRCWIKQMDQFSGNDDESTSDGERNARHSTGTAIATPSGVRCEELYGGVGTIGLNCLDLLAELRCSDENPHNKRCFEEARKEMPKKLRRRACYVPLSAAAIVQLDRKHESIACNDDASTISKSDRGSLTRVNSAGNSGGLFNVDLVIVDPPRKGLDDVVIDALLKDHTIPDNSLTRGAAAKIGASTGGCMRSLDSASIGDVVVPSAEGERKKEKKRKKKEVDFDNSGKTSDINFSRTNPKHLIYISCGFPAFKRDAARLTGENYNNVAMQQQRQQRQQQECHQAAKRLKTGHGKPAVATVSFEPAAAAAAAAAAAVPGIRYWKLVHMEGHILFPGSDHIETLAVFDRC